MVNNIFEILDENYHTYKKLPKIDYNMKPKYVYTFENYIYEKRMELLRLEDQCQNMITTNPAGGQEFQYPFTSEDYDKKCKEKNIIKNDRFLQKWIMELEFNKWSLPKIHWDNKEICDFLEITPFTPSFMINIAPDWSQLVGIFPDVKITKLRWIIEKYMEEGERFDRYSYVIENGADGNHIHAHIVAHINPRLLKSVLEGRNSHIRKGKTLDRLRYWAKAGGVGGIFGVKGKCYGLQTTILRNEELVEDKLNYLIEDLKPEGHKNKSVIGDGRVDRILFTVK